MLLCGKLKVPSQITDAKFGYAKLLCADVRLISADTAACKQGSYLHFSLPAN